MQHRRLEKLWGVARFVIPALLVLNLVTVARATFGSFGSIYAYCYENKHDIYYSCVSYNCNTYYPGDTGGCGRGARSFYLQQEAVAEGN
jgi:hypothetical protein